MRLMVLPEVAFPLCRQILRIGESNGTNHVKLPGATALITGGAVRIGKAIVLALAEAGCHVAIHYHRSAEAAEETAEEARRSGVRAVTVPADLMSPTSAAETIFDDVAAALGPVSVLVNSAAIFEAGTMGETTDEDWDRHLTINLTAPFALCREFARRHTSGRRGHIVNIVDWRATRPAVGHLAYTVAKSGLLTLTKILARELAPDVQVNAIAPGAILPAADSGAGEFDRLAEQIPLRRTGQPTDIARTLLFLLNSDFVTGEILHVTGGEQL